MNYRYVYLWVCSVFKRKKALHFFSISLGLLFSTCLCAQSANAHKVNIFAYAENGSIYAEGYFVDGSKCKNSLVEVVDNKTGEKLLEGKTDKNGQFLFDIPHATSIKLILHAGTGHQNEYTLTEEEVREAMLPAEKREGTLSVQKKQTVPEQKPLKTEQQASIKQEENSTHVTSQDIDAAVEKAIDKKLQPVMRILLNLQENSEKPGLTEILGGIGYIIGILGIIAYFKGRTKNRNNRS
jgi:nickel transport protein